MKELEELEALQGETSPMFYPVKVYDGKGKLKRTIKTKALVTRHWKKFEDKTAVINYDSGDEGLPLEVKGYVKRS